MAQCWATEEKTVTDKEYPIADRWKLNMRRRRSAPRAAQPRLTDKEKIKALEEEVKTLQSALKRLQIIAFSFNSR